MAQQDYGWHPGTTPETKRATGRSGGIFDWSDSNHWNWQAAVLYIVCGRDGRMYAKLALSNALEWTWKSGGWADPHDGSGGTLQ